MFHLVHVRAADPARLHGNDDFAWLWRRIGDLLHLDTRAEADQCPHTISAAGFRALNPHFGAKLYKQPIPVIAELLAADETLRRLEEEQTEFKDFLDRLRHAKDKEEFDQFMAQHRQRPASPSEGQPQP